MKLTTSFIPIWAFSLAPVLIIRKTRARCRDFSLHYGNPTLFWISNGWNDFQYNQASGTGSCGVCYWLIPVNNSGESAGEYFKYYAGQQRGDNSHAGTTLLKNFVGNSCSTAQYSFNTTGSVTPCAGLDEILKPINNPLQSGGPPRINLEGSRQATLCPRQNTPALDGGLFGPACNVLHRNDNGDLLGACAAGATEPYCMITSIDRYTTSFHWAETNLGAVWLRKQWYLLTNSAITEVLNGGLTFVSGGGYSSSDEVPGYWALAHKDVFIGNPQDGNPFSTNAGPFVPGGLSCDNEKGGYCANRNEGISIPLGNFTINQRLFNMYGGPVYEANNAYLQEPPKAEFNDAGTFDCSAESKECQFDPGTGYLIVTLDLSSSADGYNAAAEFACRPISFCKWDASAKSCGCNPDQTSASKAECNNACNNWATKDVRCPKDPWQEPVLRVRFYSAHPMCSATTRTRTTGPSIGILNLARRCKSRPVRVTIPARRYSRSSAPNRQG